MSGRPILLTALLLITVFRDDAGAYSVLAHEALIDDAWQARIEPLIRGRFPAVTAAQLASARAYAYGGSLIQDLGYYPFGSRFFSNLLHYARSGDFVETMVREAQTPPSMLSRWAQWRITRPTTRDIQRL